MQRAESPIHFLLLLSSGLLCEVWSVKGLSEKLFEVIEVTSYIQ